jgi:hypothetical protein
MRDYYTKLKSNLGCERTASRVQARPGKRGETGLKLYDQVYNTIFLDFYVDLVFFNPTCS